MGRDAQYVFGMVSFLLHYPEREMYDELPTLRDDIGAVKNKGARKLLGDFVTGMMDLTFDEWVDVYCQCFEFEKTTNLYVTYMKSGEQRERGIELLKLKHYYEEAGFSVSDKELPDFLPLMLEFCAQAKPKKVKELLGEHIQAVLEIEENLQKSKSDYRLVFRALLIMIEGLGISLERVTKKVEIKRSFAEEREMMRNRIDWNIHQAKGGEV